jgi:hypothetical protein
MDRATTAMSQLQMRSCFGTLWNNFPLSPQLCFEFRIRLDFLSRYAFEAAVRNQVCAMSEAPAGVG